MQIKTFNSKRMVKQSDNFRTLSHISMCFVTVGNCCDSANGPPFHDLCYHYGSTPLKNNTNHPILNNSHPLATANKAILNIKGGGGVTKPMGLSYNFDKV